MDRPAGAGRSTFPIGFPIGIFLDGLFVTVSDTLISDPMIQLRDVHLKLAGPAGPVNILRGIDLAVGAGETVSVVGPSGSGKTTMLMVIAGLERPTKGEIRVKGIDLGSLDEDGLALFRRENMGIVFQNFHLVPTMTAIEMCNVYKVLAPSKATRKKR